MLSNCFISPVVKEKIRLKLAPASPIGAPTTLTDERYKLHYLLHLEELNVVYVIKSSNIFA